MKVAVFYYSQSGQALSVAKSICGPLVEQGHQIVYKQICPLEDFPFPWDKDEFFDIFPETRLGLPPVGNKAIDFSDIEDAGLVVIAGQSWFLSPSVPIQSFFLDEEVRAYLHNRDMIFVNACRNMWLMTSRQIKRYAKEIGARLVGHIVLQDNHANLISALTIVRWLMFNRKDGKLLPDAGVSQKDIDSTDRFGNAIADAYQNDKVDTLQDELLREGAIIYKPSILFLEKAGHRMFGLWAKFIRKKGGFRDKRRMMRVNMFFYYLLFVLFVVSPFGQLFFFLTYPLQKVNFHKHVDCYLI
jgi:hypothetical protein